MLSCAVQPPIRADTALIPTAKERVVPRHRSTAKPTEPVAPELIEAAVRAAETLKRDIVEVPVTAIAAEARISRSTLLRRLGGSRSVLDAAVRAAGIDPGGRPPVRVRALTAAAELISKNGLGATTLDSIAEHADCSVFSLHAVFGGRDELLRAVFDQYSPIRDVESYFATAPDDLYTTVHGFYRTVADALSREPRVTPAMLAEVYARPASATVQSLTRHAAPRMLGALGAWLETEIKAGRIRDQPRLVLIQQLLGPIVIHMLMRPAFSDAIELALPDIDSVCEHLTTNFLAAVTIRT